jgi:hypothetical protein
VVCAGRGGEVGKVYRGDLVRDCGSQGPFSDIARLERSGSSRGLQQSQLSVQRARRGRVGRRRSWSGRQEEIDAMVGGLVVK